MSTKQMFRTEEEMLEYIIQKIDKLDEKLDCYTIECRVNANDIKNIKTIGGIILTTIGGVVVYMAGVLLA